ncbi:MAG: T9SS type A sorting domain-containing protein [Saprospiraceae bacterium]|nr:T9SS type A sorting domain-containing protein [Saprospiraceae bacterium]
MKNITLIIVTTTAFTFSSALMAQQTPLFQMTLHFEDAIGNKDSIIIGYDSNAVSGLGLIDPQFGEMVIDEPFDSVFEVRAFVAYDSSWHYLTSKKAIHRLPFVEGSSCSIADGLIFINIQHFPLTIRYDSALLNENYCHGDAILSPDQLVLTLENWQDARIFYCLGKTDKIIDDFEYYLHDPEDGWLFGEFDVDGVGMSTVRSYFYRISYFDDGYCATISDTEYTLPISHSARLFPNPNSSSSVMFDLGEIAEEIQVALYDLNGRCLRSFSSFLQQTIPIDLEGVPAGVYFVGVSTSQNSKPVHYKLIRQ